MASVLILDDTQKTCIYEKFLTGGSKRQLARQFNVSARTIGRVIEEKSKESDSNHKPKMIGSESFITVINDGVVHTVDSSAKMFSQALEYVKVGDIQKVLTLINTTEALKTYSKGNIKIIDDRVYYKDMVFDTVIAKWILEEMHNMRPFEHLVAFFERLMQNPSRKAVTSLPGFLVHNDIRITDDGYILAWKRVTNEYKDFFTETIDNSPGVPVSMPRNMVDDDSSKPCSYGLHAASYSYLPHYHGGKGRVIQLLIDPADVVAVPKEYSFAKIRVCAYKVLPSMPMYGNGFALR